MLFLLVFEEGFCEVGEEDLIARPCNLLAEVDGLLSFCSFFVGGAYEVSCERGFGKDFFASCGLVGFVLTTLSLLKSSLALAFVRPRRSASPARLNASIDVPCANIALEVCATAEYGYEPLPSNTSMLAAEFRRYAW